MESFSLFQYPAQTSSLNGLRNTTLANLSRRTGFLPEETLTNQADLLPFIADHHLAYLLPIIIYWIIGLTFHVFDTYGWFSSYKTHTPAEFLKRNHATLSNVLKYAIIQQIAQCIFGYMLSGGPELVHSHEYNIAQWAWTIRSVRSSIVDPNSVETIAVWDFAFARVWYWGLVPAFQMVVALFLSDTWQYFTHRLLHSNRWLYKHIHAVHHEIHVNYAFGGFYNHPAETIIVDAIGFPICLNIAGLSTRQSILATVSWTIKNVVDHCGYAFPYDPCNLLCPRSQWYHDLHHQSWGMKYNFSNYTPFWDWVLGTGWDSQDPKAKDNYTKSRALAEYQVNKGKRAVDPRSIAKSSAVEVNGGTL